MQPLVLHNHRLTNFRKNTLFKRIRFSDFYLPITMISNFKDGLLSNQQSP